MAVVNPERTEITAKIVYYGPGLSGKTTCIQHIYRSLPAANKGKLLSLASDVDRTIFFDFLPLKLENVQGFLLRLQLYTVPGQVRFNATRKAVLQDIDGIVFVADLQRDMLKANEESMKNLFENLKEHGRSLQDIPHVFQYNKEDLSNRGTMEEIDANVNIYKAPAFLSCALTGQGVLEALKGLTKLVVADIQRRRVIEKHLSQVAREAHAALNVVSSDVAAPEGPAGGQDASQLARRLLHSGISAPTSRVSRTGVVERASAEPAPEPRTAPRPVPPPSMELPREGSRVEDRPGAPEKEIVVFSDKAEELTSGIHRRRKVALPSQDELFSEPAPSGAFAIAPDTTEAEIDDTLAGLPDDDAQILDIPEDPVPAATSVDDTSRHTGLARKLKVRARKGGSSLAPLVTLAPARTRIEEIEAHLDDGDLDTIPRLSREALECLLDDPAVFPEASGLGPAARINMLGVKHRRYLRFRELVLRDAVSRDEALLCLHFLVDVSLAKGEVG